VPPLSPGEHATFSVHLSNRGPDAATQTYLDVEFPEGYKNVSASQRGSACTASEVAGVGTSLICPKTTLRPGAVIDVAVQVDLGLAVPDIPDVSEVELHAYHGVRDPNDSNNNVLWEPDLTNCDGAYPDQCIPPPPPDLDCRHPPLHQHQGDRHGGEPRPARVRRQPRRRRLRVVATWANRGYGGEGTVSGEACPLERGHTRSPWGPV